jgi:hypothetical protein
MTERTANLTAGACGIVAVLGAQIAFFAIVGANPGLGASPSEIQDFVTRSSARVYGGGYVEALAFPLLLVFFGRLRELLRRAEAEGGWLATTAFGAAVAALGFVTVAFAAEATAYYAGRHGADTQTVAALLDMNSLAFLLGGVPFAIFLGTTAAVVLHAGALPRWLGWSAAAIAVAVPATLWQPTDLAQIPHLLLSLWVLAVSIVLIRGRGAALAIAKESTPQAAA